MSGVLEVRQDGRVLRVTMNRPDKRNALSAALCQDLIAAFADAQASSGIGAVLLTGNGSAFCAGMDLDEAIAHPATAMEELHERLFTAYSWLGKPLVAAVHGPALAGGMGLVANAHLAIAVEEAIFGLTEIRLGLWPFLIFRSVNLALGERRAVELSLTGRIFGAREAQGYGLVHHVVPPAELESRAWESAVELADLSPDAVSTGLGYVTEARGAGVEAGGRLARTFRHQLMQSPWFRAKVEEFRARRAKKDA